jgi:Calx-beta domain
MKKRSLGFLVLVLAFRVSLEAQNPPPTVQFSAANYSAIEGAGVANLTITKTGTTTEAVTAYYKTRDGTATAPSDYTFTGDDLTASVRFEPSETSKDIQIPIKNDGYKEPDETFEVYFTVIQGASSGSPGTATVTIKDDDPQGPPPPARALNLATRARVQTGDQIMIGGFIITGSGEKRVLIRALGPSLAQAGVPASAVLLDPVIRLNKSDGSYVDFNDNWRECLATERELEGTAFQPKDDREAAMLDSLLPGAYTVWVVGKNQTQGIGLFEVYDFDANAGAELANLSTRGYVGMENDVMIAGFTLGIDPGSVQIAIRGLGPSLAGAGLHGVLADPALELHDPNGNLMGTNDDWQSDPVSAAQLTAHGLALPDSKEAGLFVTLEPGTYTAILNGESVSTGIGLVEVYNLK